jgi:hypothetical protein
MTNPTSTVFRMNNFRAVCAVVFAAGLGACQKSDSAMPADPLAGVSNGSSEPDRPRDVRPRPAQSGMSSDPNNPSGIPGPSSGLGTSPNRY